MSDNPILGGEPNAPENAPEPSNRKETKKPYVDPDPLGSVPGASRNMPTLVITIAIIVACVLVIIFGFTFCAGSWFDDQEGASPLQSEEVQMSEADGLDAEPTNSI